MLSLLRQADHALFFFVNNGWSCRLLDWVFVGFTVMGEWTIVLVALFILAADGRRALLRHVAVLAAFLTAGALLNAALKSVVDRPRPLSAFASEIAAGHAHVNVREWDKGRRVESFPSGHSALAFLVMTYVGQHKRNFRPYVLALAAGIAVSRVYVGSHFPSDCLAGALMGAAWGLAAWAIHGRLCRAYWRSA
jgi:undecaprenyl-diphosphatase